MLHLDFRAAKRFALGSVLRGPRRRRLHRRCSADASDRHRRWRRQCPGPGRIDRHRPWRDQHRRQRRFDDGSGRHAACSSGLRRRHQQPGRHRAMRRRQHDRRRRLQRHLPRRAQLDTAHRRARARDRPRCGDGKIDPGEVCDDKNTTDGDGCNATCTVQDARLHLHAGQPCVPSSICGNKRVEPGENCDDGNTTASDGCGATCQLEQGWVCPAPGSPCMRRARCGDGVVQRRRWARSATTATSPKATVAPRDCKVKGAGCICVPGMKCTCPEVRVRQRHHRGHGEVRRRQRHQRRRLLVDVHRSSAATSARWSRRPACPTAATASSPATSRAIPGSRSQQDTACSTHVPLESRLGLHGQPGHRVPRHQVRRQQEGRRRGLRRRQHRAVRRLLGDLPGRAERAPADDRRLHAASAATASCCPARSATTATTCRATAAPRLQAVEPGFTCKQPPLGDSIQVPVVYRDFADHAPRLRAGRDRPDGDHRTSSTRCWTPTGKPTFKPERRRGHVHHQRGDVRAVVHATSAAVNHATSTTMTLCRTTASGAYVNRWGAEWRAVAGHEDRPTTAATSAVEKLDADREPDPVHVDATPATDCDTATQPGRRRSRAPQ